MKDTEAEAHPIELFSKQILQFLSLLDETTNGTEIAYPF